MKYHSPITVIERNIDILFIRNAMVDATFPKHNFTQMSITYLLKHDSKKVVEYSVHT